MGPRKNILLRIHDEGESGGERASETVRSVKRTLFKSQGIVAVSRWFDKRLSIAEGENLDGLNVVNRCLSR